MADNTTVKLGMLPVNRGSYTADTWPQNIVIYKDNIVQFNGSSYIYLPSNFNLDNPAASATSLKPYDSVPSSLNPGWQVFADGNNQFTTSQRVTELGIDSVPTSGHTGYLITSDGVADAVASSNAKVGYYECATEGNEQAKVVSASDYVLSTGGSFKVKMTNKNTAASGVTLNINSTGAQVLYYDGELVTNTNTWDADEVVDVYYDGTSYYANNVSGGGKFLTGEKVKEVGIDSTPTAGSQNLVTSGGVYPMSTALFGGVDYSLKKSYTSSNGTSIGTADGVVGTIKAGTVTRWYIDAAGALTPLQTAYMSVGGVRSEDMLNVGDKTSYFDYIVPSDTTTITSIAIKDSSNNTVRGTVTVEFLKEREVAYQNEFLANNSIKVKNISSAASTSATGIGGSSKLSATLAAFNRNNMIEYNDVFVSFRVKSNKACTLYCWLGGQIDNYYNWREAKLNAAVENARGHEIIRPTELAADTYTLIHGVIRNYPDSSVGDTRILKFLADYQDTTTQTGATLDVDRIVIINISKSFGADSKVDKNTIYNYLKSFQDYYFSGEVEFVRDKLYKLNNSIPTLDDTSTKGYIILTDDCNIEMGGEINPNWSGWDMSCWSYGQSKVCDPVPSMLHGKLHTDSLFSVCPIYGNWGPKATTTSHDNWGGHVFHGWNSRMTYRLTMMASGGMTLVDGDQREDEFCIHAFSPANSVPSYPITENTPLVEKDEEDRFGNDAWYGRVRIGADTGTDGFLFRKKSLTCYGRVDLNGNKFILGDQTNIPGASDSSGKKGTITFDSNYMYVCVADNTWKRVPLETW